MSTHDLGAAGTDLAMVATAQRRLAGRARWAQRYHSLYALVWLVAVLLLGLLSSVDVDLLDGWGAGFVGLAAVVALSWVDGWAQRHTVVVRGARRLERFSGAATMILFFTVLVVGVRSFPGDPAFWVPAALLVAAPSLLAAALARRAAVRR